MTWVPFERRDFATVTIESSRISGFFWPKWEEIQTRKVVLDQETMTFTLQKTNIAMEKGPLIDDFHIKTSIYKWF